MNVVDLIVVALVVGSALHGFFRGAAVQLFSFAGFWGGLIIGSLLAPTVTAQLNSDLTKTVAAIVMVFGLAIVLGGVGERVGAKIRTSLRVIFLGAVDSGVGAAIGVIATLLAIWLIAAMLLAISPSISRPVRGSAVVQTLIKALPPAPAVFARVGRLLAPSGLPAVFAGLEPQPAPSLPAPSDPDVAAALNAARDSTVKVAGAGCGGIKSGSGFIAAPGFVVTNAHVVAGIAAPTVYDLQGRRHPTEVVLFDPEVDIAVLRVNGLSAKPLVLLRSEAPRGVTGAVLGYPGGGSFTYVPAALLEKTSAIGRDIYNQKVTTRSVYEIQADVRPGNSGGPFVSSKGQVVGVVFSASVSQANIGFALTGPVVGPEIDRAQTQTSAVGTGACSA
ncbi:MAG: MarP family serine protease [Actinomycetota bacterium]